MTAITSTHLSATARLFSSAVLKELAHRGKSPLFARLARESELVSATNRSELVYSFFDYALGFLKKKEFRHEYAYKAALTHKILLGTHNLNTASMMTEFRVGLSKADVAILNGTSTVYEIKSERDRLDRLQGQIESYRTVFAKVNIITGENHLQAIEALVPKDVGILLLNGRNKITIIRNACDAPERTIPTAIFESITRQEALAILRLLDIEAPKVPNTLAHVALRECFAKLNPTKTHECMVTVLKNTRSLLPMADLIRELPKSLHAAAFSTPLKQSDHLRLVSAIRTPLKESLKWT